MIVSPQVKRSDWTRWVAFRPQMISPEVFRRELAQWFYAAHECRIDLVRSESQTELHRGLMSSLIAWGEWAQMEAVEQKIDLAPIGITVEDLQAEIRIFRDTYRSAFDNCLTHSEAETILKEVFG